MKIETIDDMAPVMGADGQFHALDEVVDLSGTKFEAWVALGFFWEIGRASWRERVLQVV